MHQGSSVPKVRLTRWLGGRHIIIGRAFATVSVASRRLGELLSPKFRCWNIFSLGRSSAVDPLPLFAIGWTRFLQHERSAPPNRGMRRKGKARRQSRSRDHRRDPPLSPDAPPHWGFLFNGPDRGTPPYLGGYRRARMHAMAVAMHDIVKLLREMAQTCTRLARRCPHRATSHGLEEIAVGLAAKAEELERDLELRS